MSRGQAPGHVPPARIRPDAGIRFGPHFFTSDDELRFAIEQIGEILETGAHEPHLGVVARH